MIKQDMNAFRIPETQRSPTLRSPDSAAPAAPVARRLEPPARLPATAAHDALMQPAASSASVLSVLRARLTTIAVVILLVMAIAVFAMLQFTPVYRSTAVIGFGPDPAGRPIEERLRDDQARLMSWTLAEKVILKLNLMRDPEINTALTRRTFYRISTWFTPARPKTPVVIPPGTGALTLQPGLLAQFARGLEVTAIDGKSIRITYAAEDPQKAARIANALAAQLRLEQPSLPDVADLTSGEVAAAGAGLSTQLAQHAAELRSAEDKLEQYRARRDGLSPVVLARPPALEAQLVSAQRRLAALEIRQRKAREAIDRGGDLGSIATVLDTPEVAGLGLQQATLARRSEELASMFGAGHAETIAIEDERRVIDGRIAALIKSAQERIAGEVALARRSLDEIKGQFDEAPTMPTLPPVSAQDLARLEAAVRDARARYEALLARTLSLPAAGETSNATIRITQAARAADEPVFPNRPMTLGVSLFGATMLAFCVALMRGPVRTGLRRGGEVERAAGLSNLALIPEAAPTARLEDWILQDPHSAVSTALGALYASLSHSMDEGGGRILAITSAEPGCGTTSIAMALGRIAAREGLTRRVLLIDADFRRADLGGRLQPPAGLGVARAEDGLVEVLAGEVDLAHAIRRDRYTSMDLLPIAGTFSSPVELLATRSMQRLVEVLRQHYDLVIVNTPSVRVFPEAQRMAQLADTSLLVLNWDETSRSALVESVRILRQAGAHIAGTVLNRCGQRQDQRAAQ